MGSVDSDLWTHANGGGPGIQMKAANPNLCTWRCGLDSVNNGLYTMRLLL